MLLSSSRIVVCLGALAGLASCHRATYPFASQPAYLSAPTGAGADLPTAAKAASAPPARRAILPSLPKPARGILAPGLASKPTALRRPPARLGRPTRHSLPARPLRLATWLVPARNAAGPIPYSSDLGSALLLLFVYCMLLFVLIGAGIFLLVKRALRLIRSRRHPAAPPPER